MDGHLHGIQDKPHAFFRFPNVKSSWKEILSFSLNTPQMNFKHWWKQMWDPPQSCISSGTCISPAWSLSFPYRRDWKSQKLKNWGVQESPSMWFSCLGDWECPPHASTIQLHNVKLHLDTRAHFILSGPGDTALQGCPVVSALLLGPPQTESGSQAATFKWKSQRVWFRAFIPEQAKLCTMFLSFWTWRAKLTRIGKLAQTQAISTAISLTMSVWRKWPFQVHFQPLTLPKGSHSRLP